SRLAGRSQKAYTLHSDTAQPVAAQVVDLEFLLPVGRTLIRVECRDDTLLELVVREGYRGKKQQAEHVERGVAPERDPAEELLLHGFVLPAGGAVVAAGSERSYEETPTCTSYASFSPLRLRRFKRATDSGYPLFSMASRNLASDSIPAFFRW